MQLSVDPGFTACSALAALLLCGLFCSSHRHLKDIPEVEGFPAIAGVFAIADDEDLRHSAGKGQERSRVGSLGATGVLSTTLYRMICALSFFLVVIEGLCRRGWEHERIFL